MVGDELHALGARQRIDIGQIADTHRRITQTQAGIEGGIALGGELTVDVEGSVNREHGMRIEDGGQTNSDSIKRLAGKTHNRFCT